MNTVDVDGVYIGKAKNLGQGLISDTDKRPVASRLWLWPQGLGSVAWALRCFYREPLEHSGLKKLVDCPALASRWRDIANKRMRTGLVEDWSARLLGLPLEGLSA